MRIGVMSDASGPTSANYPGHGLGRTVARMAAGLSACGHEVTLFAARGSEFEGRLITPVDVGDYRNEKPIAQAAYDAFRRGMFDVLIDNTHTHVLSGVFPTLPVLNYYHDMWQPLTHNAVLCSEGQRALMAEKDFEWARQAVVVHHALDASEFTFGAEAIKPPYALFLGIVRNYKQPLLAIKACAKLDMKLLLVGPQPPGLENVVSADEMTMFVGPQSGAYKTQLIREASVVLQLGLYEAFGLTTVEAGLCGTPVVAWPSGGAVDLVEYGVNGTFVPSSKNMAQATADAIERALQIPRQMCRDKALQFSCVGKWIEQIEGLLKKVARGERW